MVKAPCAARRIDEVMMLTTWRDFAARKRSSALLADIFGLEAPP
jgi:hypothetical protein